jgi:hypothetical protein
MPPEIKAMAKLCGLAFRPHHRRPDRRRRRQRPRHLTPLTPPAVDPAGAAGAQIAVVAGDAVGGLASIGPPVLPFDPRRWL